jgi:hypothetical protein
MIATKPFLTALSLSILLAGGGLTDLPPRAVPTLSQESGLQG